MTPGSTRRILRTLEKLGFAVSDDGRFCLTPRVLNLGFAYLSSQPFSQVAQPLLGRLARDLGATCCITVLDERDVVFIARGTHKPIEPFYVYVGARLPAYATAPGKVLLAGLPAPELRRRLDGWELASFTPNTIRNSDELSESLRKTRDWASVASSRRRCVQSGRLRRYGAALIDHAEREIGHVFGKLVWSMHQFDASGRKRFPVDMSETRPHRQHQSESR